MQEKLGGLFDYNASEHKTISHARSSPFCLSISLCATLIRTDFDVFVPSCTTVIAYRKTLPMLRRSKSLFTFGRLSIIDSFDYFLIRFTLVQKFLVFWNNVTQKRKILNLHFLLSNHHENIFKYFVYCSLGGSGVHIKKSGKSYNKVCWYLIPHIKRFVLKWFFKKCRTRRKGKFSEFKKKIK